MTLQNIKLLMKGKNVNKNGELSACQYHHTARPPKISTFINGSTNKKYQGRLQKNGKENDIVQKGGGVRKKINLCYVLLKVTFYQGRGVD